jgi:pimeloyl-ACP methyl ester carboxylesterase
MSQKDKKKKTLYSTENFETAGGKKKKKKGGKVKMDWKFLAITIPLTVLFIIAVWMWRLPANYAHMFIGHYEGTTDALEEFKMFDHTDEETDALVPLQEDYDNWKQQNLGYPMTIKGANNATLSAYYYDQGSNVTVVMLHSFDESKDGDELLAPYFWSKGYNIFIPDLRDHGDSGGGQVTWGLNESKDLVAELDAITQTYGDQQFILYGNLLGAGSELMAMENLPDSVDFIIAEDAYPSLTSLAKCFCKNLVHVPAWAGVPLLNSGAKRAEDFSIKSVDVADSVTDKIPVLLVYGSDDQILSDDAEQEMEDAFNGNTEVLTISGGRYETNYAMGKEQYEQKIDEYIYKYVK